MKFRIWGQLTKADNIYHSIKPLVYISLIGLAPFRIRSNNEVQTSATGVVLSVVHFSFYGLCFGLSLLENDSIIGYFFKTNITQLADRTLMLSGVITMLTIFGLALFKRNNLIQVIEKSIIIDEIFVWLGLKLNYQVILWYSLVMSIGMVGLTLGYMLISYFLLISACITPSFVVFTTFALPHINMTIMVFKFMCTTHTVRSRFQMMNKILQDILDDTLEEKELNDLPTVRRMVKEGCCTSNCYNITSLVHQNPQQSLKEITTIHNILCDICIKIEEYFTYPLLTIITISFMFIVFDGYYILEVLFHPNRVEYFEFHEFFAFFISQMFWYAIIIIVIVEGSSSTMNEAERSSAVVSKLLNASEDLELRERLMRLSMQLEHRKIRFTAAGLFALDRTLIFTISGAATCYLIILIQFRPSMVYHDDSPNISNCSKS